MNCCSAATTVTLLLSTLRALSGGDVENIGQKKPHPKRQRRVLPSDAAPQMLLYFLSLVFCWYCRGLDFPVSRVNNIHYTNIPASEHQHQSPTDRPHMQLKCHLHFASSPAERASLRRCAVFWHRDMLFFVRAPRGAAAHCNNRKTIHMCLAAKT